MRTLAVVTRFCLECIDFLLTLSFPNSLASRVTAAFVRSWHVAPPSLLLESPLPSTNFASLHPSPRKSPFPHPFLSLLQSPLTCARVAPPLSLLKVTLIRRYPLSADLLRNLLAGFHTCTSAYARRHARTHAHTQTPTPTHTHTL